MPAKAPPPIVLLFHAFGDLNSEITRVALAYRKLLERLQLFNGPWTTRGSYRKRKP